jgi:hypothetical protein
MNNRGHYEHGETAGENQSAQHKKTVSEPAQHCSINSIHQGISSHAQQSYVAHSTKEGIHQVLLLTAIIQVCNETGPLFYCCALLDTY